MAGLNAAQVPEVEDGGARGPFSSCHVPRRPAEGAGPPGCRQLGRSVDVSTYPGGRGQNRGHLFAATASKLRGFPGGPCPMAPRPLPALLFSGPPIPVFLLSPQTSFPSGISSSAQGTRGPPGASSRSEPQAQH